MHAQRRPAAIHARGWGLRHPGRRDWAIRGVDLRIEAGERVLLVGPSGSGKSTVLAAIAGLLDPQITDTEGELLVDGRVPRRASGSTGLLFQDPESQLVMGRAGDDVAFGLENRCVPTSEIPARVLEALASVDFPYGVERSTDALSGGERQRLALAGILALRPGLLLLDEPTANLDPGSGDRIRSVLRRVLNAGGTTLVLVEHRIEASLSLVDRLVVIDGASGIVADGPPSEILAGDPARLARRGVWAPGFRPAAAGGREGRPAPVSLVHAQHASFRYPAASVDAVGPVDVDLRSSEALAITGATGSGKSTLAMLLGGLVAPREGRVTATEALAHGRGGEPIAGWRARDLVRHIGSVFQDPEHQFLASSVRAELMVGPRRTGRDEIAASTRADELLERLALTHLAAANPFTLSGGEKRRLSVATALATAPRLLVLDEPTFGQDPRGWAELLELLRELRDDGHGICIVTHDDHFVRALADRTFHLTGGA